MRSAKAAVPAICSSALTACLLLAGAVLPAGAGAAATPPPSLVTLEQKLSELKLSSERVKIAFSIEVPKAGGFEKQLLEALAHTYMEVEAAPSQASGIDRVDFDGKHEEIVLTGGHGYAKVPGISKLDGGRPWVRVSQAEIAALQKSTGQELALGANPLSSSTTPAAGLQQLVSGAREITELGPGTVAGETVTRYLLTLEPSQLEASQLESGSSLSLSGATVTAELSLDAEGLPVQMIIKIGSSSAGMTVTAQVSATNFPLEVTAPPARETIAAKQLKALEKKARQKKKH